MSYSTTSAVSEIGQPKLEDLEKNSDLSYQLAKDNEIGLIRTASDPAFRRGSTTTIPDKTLGPCQAAVIFITNEIGIGILSLPSALNTLGIVPGVITIIGMGLLSLYSGYILVQFYRRYPTVVNIVDYGRILGGRTLELVFATGFVINLVLISASAVITVSIGLNTTTDNAVCTIGFVAVPIIVCWLLCFPRTMKFVAWCGWPCTVSIVSAVLIVMVSLGIRGPRNASLSNLNIKVVGDPSFAEATSAFLNVAFAYTGNQAFPSVLAEMKDPSRDFAKAICIEKCFAILMYVVVAVVCYCLAGETVTSPAIGSAPVMVAKVSYGIIFVSLFGTGLVFGHTAIKYLHLLIVRQLKKCKQRQSTDERSECTIASWGSQSTNIKSARILWIAIATIFWVFVFIVANAIPVFNSLLNISASVLLAWFTWGLPAVFWLHLNWSRLWFDWRKRALFVLNCFMLVVTLYMNSGGLYASITGLLSVFSDPNNNVDGPFSCGDNSIF